MPSPIIAGLMILNIVHTESNAVVSSVIFLVDWPIAGAGNWVVTQVQPKRAEVITDLAI